MFLVYKLIHFYPQQIASSNILISKFYLSPSVPFYCVLYHPCCFKKQEYELCSKLMRKISWGLSQLCVSHFLALVLIFNEAKNNEEACGPKLHIKASLSITQKLIVATTKSQPPSSFIIYSFPCHTVKPCPGFSGTKVLVVPSVSVTLIDAPPSPSYWTSFLPSCPPVPQSLFPHSHQGVTSANFSCVVWCTP